VNNREKATLIWLGVALAAALMSRDIRGSLWACVRAFASLKIVGPLLLFAGWTVGLVALAHAAGLWEADVRSDTVVWFITVGVALFFSLDKATEDGFFRRTARRAVAITALVEGFVNLEVFGLAAELVFLPVMALLAGMLVVSEGKDEYAPTRSFLNRLLSIIGVCVLAYVLVRLATHFDTGHTVRALALPVWLIIGSIPFVYAFALVAEYEQAFLRIDLHTDDPTNRRRAKRGLLRSANVRVADLGGFAGHWIGDLASTQSDEAARVLMQRWRTTWRAERQAERLEDAREYVNRWLTESQPALREIYADTLKQSWERLDSDQRATLRAEGLRRAARRLADEVRALPD
jgi:hypothetical protein